MPTRPAPTLRRGLAAALAVALIPTVAVTRTAQAQQAPVKLRLDGVVVQVTPDPWHLRITDDAGRVVLDERAGTGPTAAGTLGF